MITNVVYKKLPLSEGIKTKRDHIVVDKVNTKIQTREAKRHIFILLIMYEHKGLELHNVKEHS